MLQECPLCFEKWNGNVKKISRLDFYKDGASNPKYHACFLNDEIYICPQCHSGIVYPFHTQKELMEYYFAWGQSQGHSKIYHPYQSHVLSHILHVTDAKSQKYTARIMQASLFREFKPNENYLEIGAGYGKGIRAAQIMLPPMNYYAIEPDHTACQALRLSKVNVIESGFNEESARALGDKKFHFIMMYATLDHLNSNEVLPTLKLIKNLLAEDGILQCNVRNYYDMNLPNKRPNMNHLTLFTPIGLRRAMEHSGFNVNFLKSAGKPGRLLEATKSCEDETNFNASTKIYNLIKKMCPSFIKGIFKPMIVPKRERYINRRLFNKKMTLEQSLKILIQGEEFQYGQKRHNLTCVVTHKEL